MEKVYIFDTTLRDGEQTPGCAFTATEKLEIAEQLQRLKVDIIEAGFPAASRAEFEAVNLIAKNITQTTVCALARAKKEDIDTALEALKDAKKPRLHIFIATSPIHIKYKLKMQPEQVLETIYNMVKYGSSLIEEVEFSSEDATRSEVDFLCKAIEIAINSGAKIINIPDTVGYIMPFEFEKLIRNIIERLQDIINKNKVIISVHCHNDLGLAVANTLAAISAGARQVEVTINGLGERAGNAALEEVVMAIKTRPTIFNNLFTEINTEQLYKTSRIVSTYSGITPQPNKAIIGNNAFAHSSGIHQDGVLKLPLTYEIMKPEDVGLSKSKIVLGKLSGRHAFKKRLEDLGYKLEDEKIDEIFPHFKELAANKPISDRDLEALVEDFLAKGKEKYILDYFCIVTGKNVIPTATVQLKIRKNNKEEQVYKETADGDGPIAAAYKAIDKITGLKCELLEFSLKSITSTKEALGEAIVKIIAKMEQKKFAIGRGVSTDVIEASIKAYLNAINKLFYK